MTKSELIEIIAARQNQLSAKDVELAVKTLIEQMSETLATGERIEIRGFGSFSHFFLLIRLFPANPHHTNDTAVSRLRLTARASTRRPSDPSVP